MVHNNKYSINKEYFMNENILEIAKKIENEGGRLYLVGRSCKR